MSAAALALAPNGANGAAGKAVDRDAKAKDKKAKKKARAKEKKADAKEQSEKIAKIKAEIAAKADAEDAVDAAAAAANGDSESAAHGSNGVAATVTAASGSSSSSAATHSTGSPAAVQYVREEQEVSDEFRAMFAKFLTPEQLAVREESIDEFTAAEQERAQQQAELAASNAAGAGGKGPDIHTPVPVDSTGKKLSRKERKRKGRLDIAELKQAVERPDVVELHDTNSSDPKTLVHLKGYRNSVAVPKHWAMKRKYLQGKRGVEKPPFQLPQCIADTGIAQLRGAMQEKTDSKGAKGKAREKTQVKMGKLDIDYQVLHDAFFRHQTKPRMTEHGQMYYEGKELEVRHKDARPGYLSEALRNALGMADEKSPPPWLYVMQRFGPPPCYPFLKVPGVNAPIPEGARWGPGEGEWGVAPVDGFGRPLFGDVFGQERREEDEHAVDRALWGLMGDDEDEPEPSDDEKDDGAAAAAAADADADEAGAGSVSSAAAAAMAAAGGGASAGADSKRGTESVTSQSTGLETPQAVPLRKSDGTGTETPDAVRALYTVLQEKGASVGGAMFGTSHTYVLPTAASEAERKLAEKKAKAAGAVDVALAPEELEGVDAATLKRKYEATVAAQSAAAAAGRTDVSDVVAEETQKKKRKLDKSAAADGGKKKDKFKF